MKRLRYLTALFLASCYIEASFASSESSDSEDHDYNNNSRPFKRYRSNRSTSNDHNRQEVISYHHSNNNSGMVYPVTSFNNPFPQIIDETNKALEIISPSGYKNKKVSALSRLMKERERDRDFEDVSVPISKIEEIAKCLNTTKDISTRGDQDLKELLKTINMNHSLVTSQLERKRKKESKRKQESQKKVSDQQEKIQLLEVNAMKAEFNQEITQINNKHKVENLQTNFQLEIKDLTKDNKKLENKLLKIKAKNNSLKESNKEIKQKLQNLELETKPNGSTNDISPTQRRNSNRRTSSEQPEIGRILIQERDQTRRTLNSIYSLIKTRKLYDDNTLNTLKSAIDQPTIGHDEIRQIINSLHNKDEQGSEDDD